VAAFAAALLVPCFAAGAQCPDGSPPPCRGSTAAAPARRVNPPLDNNTWIVVPFDNLAKSEDTEWLRSASVNLLYLDMSKWRDIKVVDDERVADLLRETPEAAASSNLSLKAGLAVAARAGAGKLVMGDVLKLGNRTTVTAKIYDVRTGQRSRSVREDATVADSVMPLFGKLAQKILNVAPPAGTSLGAIGTSRVDAYQSYLAGVAALNRFDLKEARRHLTEALTLDSTFALAHYKMSIVIGWDNTADVSQTRHAEAAARFQAGLPARERTLIQGLVHQAKNEWTKACQVYGALARADSSDVEAVYGWGECLFHDPMVTPIDADTTRFRTNADYQRSIRAFTRVLALDPQYHLAYQHIIDALNTERFNRAYCTDAKGCRAVSGFNIRLGDSLSNTVVLGTDTAKIRQQQEQYIATRSKIRNLAAAREIAEQWARVAPGESRAQIALATVMIQQGLIARADTVLANIKEFDSLIEQLRTWLFRMEVAYKRGRTGEAARLYDSARTHRIAIPGSTVLQFGNAISGYGPAFGRLAEFDSLMAMNLRGAPPQVAPYQRMLMRLVVGVVNDSLVQAERAMFEATRAARGVTAATRSISGTLRLGLHQLNRPSWPGIDTTIKDLQLRPAIALSRGDTAALRLAAQAIDSAAHALVAIAANDSGFTAIAAEAYLALGDSAAALRILRYGLDEAAATAVYFPLQSQGLTSSALVPRMLLLRADLAAAAGSREEARIFYGRFIDAFSYAYEELQPLVERARKSRAALAP
jgi:tetratricopeptide (TPR) repeat protein/TolB-like protein